MKPLFLLVLLIPFLGLAYVLWHVWHLLPLPLWCRWLAVVAGTACLSLLFVAVSQPLDKMPMGLAATLYDIGTSSLIILLYAVMLFLLLDLGRLAGIVPRSFLSDSWAGTLTVAGTLLVIFIYGGVNYHHKVRHTLQLRTEKKLERPVRAVLLSDLHLGYHNRRAEVSRWVDLINAEKPDVVLIAGDIIDRSLRPLEEEGSAQELRRLQAPVFACLGNHEYYAGENGSEAFYREAGITLLRDSVLESGDLLIAGRDDRTNPRRKRVEQLLKGADRSKYVVLLDHQPYHLEEAEHAGVDFQLSGHTHQGQVWPISWITNAIYECAYGAWQRGRTNYYVSSGLGIWGGKFRIGTCSEYVVAEISQE